MMCAPKSLASFRDLIFGLLASCGTLADVPQILTKSPFIQKLSDRYFSHKTPEEPHERVSLVPHVKMLDV